MLKQKVVLHNTQDHNKAASITQKWFYTFVIYQILITVSKSSSETIVET